jgi:hypothetical protein
LGALIAGVDGILFSEAIDAEGAIVFARACEMGLVRKRLGGAYWSGRVRNWLKVKNPSFVGEDARANVAAPASPWDEKALPRRRGELPRRAGQGCRGVWGHDLGAVDKARSSRLDLAIGGQTADRLRQNERAGLCLGRKGPARSPHVWQGKSPDLRGLAAGTPVE